MQIQINVTEITQKCSMMSNLKVKPYFDKSISFIERNEMMVYKVGFIIMFVLNFVQMFRFQIRKISVLYP